MSASRARAPAALHRTTSKDEQALTLARASSGIRLPRSVPMMGKYMPTVASNAQNAQKRIARDVLSALVTRARAAAAQVTLARLACRFTVLSAGPPSLPLLPPDEETMP